MVRTIAAILTVVALGSAGARQLPPQRASERNVEQLQALARGPHLGAPEEAVVGIEVTNRTADSAAEQTRRGAGFVIRCDGFVLAPASLFGRSIAVAGTNEEAASQSVAVIIHPGTPRESRVTARPPRYIPRNLDYCVLKMEGAHVPALRTLLPDAMKAGDSVQTEGVAWDAAARAFRIMPRATGVLGPPPAPPEGEPAPGEAGIALTQGAAAAGSVVLGPGGTAIGLVVSAPGGRVDRFITFADLNRATNCVTPLAIPPGVERDDEGDMVDVPGGPFVVPPAVLKDQPDMAGLGVACVAPFKIDRTEVTNKQYLEFWLSLPESDRKRLGFQSNYFPSSWSKTDAPFPQSIAELPVIGVPMPGAAAYAKARGKRLPTPYEWALAAFGPKGDQDVAWARRYVAERNDVWSRVKALHREYLQFHPELQQETYYTPTHFDLPWMNSGPPLLNAARWSRQTVLEACEPLWQAWRDPLYLEPVGTRDFDTSPYGARDMLLNAAELVQPYPGGPINSRPRWMEVEWVRREPSDKDPWRARPLTALAQIDALPPLSRLYRRAFLSPPPNELLSLSNMSEVVSMLAPLDGWALHATQDSTITVSGLLPRRQTGPVVLGLSEAGLYAERPRHYRPEIGLPAPPDHTDRSPSAGPQLYYLAATGFRCVR